MAEIGNWTESDLSRYIREYLERFLPSHIPSLTVDDLIVTDTLDSQGSVNFHRHRVQVGSSGAPPFTNGWTNFGGTTPPAAYFKDQNGLVFLEGLIMSGTLGVAAFVLPPGYKPDNDRLFIVWSNNTLGAVQVVAASGNVIPLTFGTASNASYSLDGIQFRTGKT